MKCPVCNAEAYPTPTGYQCAAYSNHRCSTMLPLPATLNGNVVTLRWLANGVPNRVHGILTIKQGAKAGFPAITVYSVDIGVTNVLFTERDIAELASNGDIILSNEFMRRMN